jgi:putative hemolysin
MLPDRRETGFLRGFCRAFTFPSRFRAHTRSVISGARQEVPLKPAVASTPLVEFHFPSSAPPLSLKVEGPRVSADVGRYRLRLAGSEQDREAACRLRFRVFNIELGEGLESSYETGLDRDKFDAVCEHLLVEDKESRRVVGTYRMQAGAAAALHLGYYSGQEFVLAPYEPLRPQILELGRASIDREHRTPEVLTLLWRGIAQYAHAMGLRYLLGCSSVNSCDPADGWRIYRQLESSRVQPEFETEPTAAFACPIEQRNESAQPPFCQEDRFEPAKENAAAAPISVPRLLRAYLAIGARIAAPPAWDRGFRTIDFLTLLDLKMLSPAARNRFMAPLNT